MKRRTFLAGSVIGITSLSGCTGLFNSKDNKNDNTNNNKNNNQVDIPNYNGLSKTGINNDFLEMHFSELNSIDSFTVTHKENISTGSPQERKWYRQNNIGYQILSSERDIEREWYYGKNIMGVRSVSTDSINLVERSIPPTDKWANADLLKSIIEKSTFKISSETNSTIVYTGVADLNKFNSPQGFTLEISKDRPIITSINFTDISESYTIKKINQTTVSAPSWYTKALKEHVIVTGGGYNNANALILEISEYQKKNLNNLLLTVVGPSGNTHTTQINETLKPGDSVFLVLRQGNLFYSINRLPPVSDRDKLQNGIYTLLGSTMEGDHLFELKIKYSQTN